MMQNNQEALYMEYLERLRVKVVSKYDEMGLRSSGEFERQLEKKVEVNKLTLFGAKHSYQMENGRRAGKFPPVKEIENWIDKKKGLPSEWKTKKTSIAWAIATNMAKKGIRVPNDYNKGKVISSVVEDFLAKDMREMLDKLGIIFLRRMESDVINILKTAR